MRAKGRGGTYHNEPVWRLKKKRKEEKDTSITLDETRQEKEPSNAVTIRYRPTKREKSLRKDGRME